MKLCCTLSVLVGMARVPATAAGADVSAGFPSLLKRGWRLGKFHTRDIGDSGACLQKCKDLGSKCKGIKWREGANKSCRLFGGAYTGDCGNHNPNPPANKDTCIDVVDPSSCTLPRIASDGQPVWAQTGQVMTQFEEVLNPRKRFPATSGKSSQRRIQHNDQYMVYCDAKTYLADQMCVVTCNDGVLDTTTYCGIDPADVCKQARELTYISQCPLDFDSDAPFHAGKSLKDWWNEVIDRFYSSGDAIWDRTSDLPFYMGHGSAFLEGYGVAAQHFGQVPNEGEDETTFEADIVDITGWVSEGYEYGPDTLTNSQTTPINAYVDLDAVVEPDPSGTFNLPRIDQSVTFPNPKMKALSIIRNVYDPCDTNTYFGFAPECFLYHPAGYHVGNGKMLNFLSPLSNGEIDVLGVCNTTETVPPLTFPGLMQNMANVADYISVSGGLIAAHPVSATLHLCIDEEDIYHPRLCPWHTDDAEIDNMNGDFVSVDARPFMPMPTAQRNMLCEKREANPGICDGPFDNITQPYPWTQHL